MVEFSTFYYNMKCTSVYPDDENEWWNCYIVMIIKLKKRSHITAYMLMSSQFDWQRLP